MSFPFYFLSSSFLSRPSFLFSSSPYFSSSSFLHLLSFLLLSTTSLLNRWTSEVSEDIKTRLKDLAYSRYKFVVQVVIGEQRGEGVKMATKCFWDSETDNYAKHVFTNENFFVVAVAFGSYYY